MDLGSAIQEYFPQSQWSNAACILMAEKAQAMQSCPGADPSTCVADLPDYGGCYPDQTPGPATASGLYGIVDRCWDPSLAGDNTPFTPQEWAARLDPLVNVWMASVVYSIAGWRGWSTCSQCGCCDVTGMPIPHPRGP